MLKIKKKQNHSEHPLFRTKKYTIWARTKYTKSKFKLQRAQMSRTHNSDNVQREKQTNSERIHHQNTETFFVSDIDIKSQPIYISIAAKSNRTNLIGESSLCVFTEHQRKDDHDLTQWMSNGLYSVLSPNVLFDFLPPQYMTAITQLIIVNIKQITITFEARRSGQDDIP